LIQQKQRSLKGYDKWWEDILQSGELPRIEGEHIGRPDCASMESLQSSLQEIRGCEHESKKAIKGYLRMNVPGLDPKWRVGGKGHGGAKFPSLEECRAAFEGRVGGVWQWDMGVKRWAEKAVQRDSGARAPNGRVWKQWRVGRF